MSIQKKLSLAFGAMVVIPVAIFLLGAVTVLHVLGEGSRFTGADDELERMKTRDRLFGEMKLLTTSDAAKLEDFPFLEKMDGQLGKWEYGLLLRIGNETIYVTENFSSIPQKALPPFGEFANQIHESVKAGEASYKFRQHDYFTPDGQKASIFIIEKASGLEQIATDYAPWILAGLVLILILTNGTLSYLVSRGIINPLKVLQQSARKITDGNLEFSLVSNRKDEIGALISDFESMRERLKESIETQIQYENDRKLLLSNISHDLKTPISSIKGYVEGLLDGIADTEEKRRKYLTTIYSRANEMNAMIDDLFLVSTLDLKQVPFHFEKVELNNYIKKVADDAKLDMAKRGIKLGVELDSSPIWVQADREKLGRVISNIFQNSVKYMDKKDGKVTITLMNDHGSALLKIEDNGQGIPEEALPHIFETFYRAESSRSKKTGGTGLGLTIAKQIIDEHKGTIQAESKRGIGTAIFFTIPLENG